MLRCTLYSTVFLFITTGLASAQTPEQMRERGGPPPVDNGWSLFVGGGGFYAPTYSGDDDYALSAVPFLRVTKGDRFFASIQEGAGYAVINADGFKAGPLLTLDFGRDEDGSSPFRVSGDKSLDLVGLGNISTTLALGGFADYKVGDIKFKAKAGKALGSHEGLSGEIGIDYTKTIRGGGPPLIVAFGPQIKLADSKYMQAFYGITAGQAAASSLSAFDASGGIVSYGVGGSALMPLTQKMSINVFGSYDRLAGDAADSPLVVQRGSADQVFIGSAVAYKF